MRKIDIKEAKHLFSKFLLSNCILGRYIANVIDQRTHPTYDGLKGRERTKKIISRIVDQHYIEGWSIESLFGHSQTSFLWKNTPEGMKYWGNMRRKWSKFLMKKNIDPHIGIATFE